MEFDEQCAIEFKKEFEKCSQAIIEDYNQRIKKLNEICEEREKTLRDLEDKHIRLQKESAEIKLNFYKTATENQKSNNRTNVYKYVSLAVMSFLIGYGLSHL